MFGAASHPGAGLTMKANEGKFKRQPHSTALLLSQCHKGNLVHHLHHPLFNRPLKEVYMHLHYPSPCPSGNPSLGCLGSIKSKTGTSRRWASGSGSYQSLPFLYQQHVLWQSGLCIWRIGGIVAPCINWSSISE